MEWLRRWRHDLFRVIGLAILGILCAGLSAVVLPTGRIDIGTTYALPYISGFHGLERNQQFSYAFTKEQATVAFPGIGANWTVVAMRASGYRPDGVPPAEVTITADRLDPVTIRLRRQVARYYVLLPPGDDYLRLHFTSSTFSTPSDPRELGFAIDWVRAYQLVYGWPWQQSVHLALIGVLGYWLMRRLAVTPMPAVVITTVALVVLAGLLATFPLEWAIFTPMLWWLFVGLHVVLGPLRALTRFAFVRGGETLPQWYETWLWRIVVCAAIIKIGGVIYPQTIVYDERWHVPRTQMVLDGRFMELVIPSRVTLLGDTVGFEGGHFPYSPLWYLITAPFGLIGIDLGLASNVLNTALDVSRSLLIAYITLRLFGQPGIAVAAAGCYHLLLMPYFLISWGNWPTQLGLWGTLVLIAVVLAYHDDPTDRWTVWGLAAAATLAILTYTVVGIMAFTMMGIYAIAELIRRESLAVQRGRSVILGLVIAEGVAFVIYHMWYVPTIVTETLPAITSALDRRIARANPLPLPTPAIDAAFILNHLTWPGIFLIVGGAVLAWLSAKRAHALLLAWWSILILYSLVNWTIADMILKHVFFMLPLAAICMALALNWLWKQSVPGRIVAGLSLAYLALSVAARWYHFIMEKRHIA
jgi:hypothetical protein